ncbi:small ribosomal subunit Rsm22 family protein [Methanospirillum sp.]
MTDKKTKNDFIQKFVEKKNNARKKKKDAKKNIQPEKATKTGNLRIPSRLERLFEQYIEIKTGKPVDSPQIIEKIKNSILAQKAGYWNKSPHAKYGKAYDVFAYMAYQAPGYIIQFKSILKILENDKVLAKDLVVLDLGTGPGVVPLSLIWYMKEKRSGTLTIHAIEQSEEFLEAFRYLISSFATESSIKTGIISHTDIKSVPESIPDELNLITCQNVLAELPDMSNSEKVTLLMKYISHLSDDGFLVIVEPAELRHSTQLRILQKELEKAGLYVYSPCRYLHDGSCNPENCWSFLELPLMKSTRLMDLLSQDKDGYRFVNTDIKCSYSILSKKPRPLISHVGMEELIPFYSLEDYLGEKISVAGVKLSNDLGTRDFAIFLICDGTGSHKVYLIIPRTLKTEEVKMARYANYGDILRIDNVRVRWNPKKNSYNLVSGTRTRVSAMNK